MRSSDGGSGMGNWDTCGYWERNWSLRFLDNMVATWLVAAVICSATMSMSYSATKSQRHLSRCITSGCLDEPLLMAATKLKLSRCNCCAAIECIAWQDKVPIHHNLE